MQTTIILGGPGAGKTTRLLEIVEDCLRRGVEPNRLAFVSYTKAAVVEAITRAIDRFGVIEEELPWFRTLHSIGYRRLGIRRGGLMEDEGFDEFGELVGYDLSDRRDEDRSLVAGEDDDGTNFLRVMSYGRAREISLREAWRAAGEDIDWYTLEWFADAYSRFKEHRALIDYDDIISNTRGSLPIDVAIVDETQDLSTAQWSLVWRLLSDVKELYVAGDDDQAIYQWNGADVEKFIGLQGKVETLPVSHRLPNEVFDYAAQIAGSIRYRRPREWSSAGHSGDVSWVGDPTDFDLSSGTWMLLARNVAMLSPYREECERQGVAYTTKKGSSIRKKEVDAIIRWEALKEGKSVTGADASLALSYRTGKVPALDDETYYSPADLGLGEMSIWHEALVRIPMRRRIYYLEILRRGEKLTSPPRVHVGTIHSVKGREADNVVLRADMTARTWRSYELDADPEHRVFYVGATRARKNLYLVQPQSVWAYDL